MEGDVVGGRDGNLSPLSDDDDDDNHRVIVSYIYELSFNYENEWSVIDDKIPIRNRIPIQNNEIQNKNKTMKSLMKN